MIFKNRVANCSPWFGQPPVLLKFYWNTAMCILLLIVYGHFCAVSAELSSSDTDYMAYKA